MQRPASQSPTTTQSASVVHRSPIDTLRSRSPPSNMAAAVQRHLPNTLPHIINFRDQRPTLPPLSNLESIADRHATSPLTTPPITRVFNSLDPFQRQPLPQSSPTASHVGPDARFPPSSILSNHQSVESRDPFLQSQQQNSPYDAPDNPLKRSFNAMTQPPLRYPQPSQPVVTSLYAEPRPLFPPSAQAQFPVSSRSSYSDASTTSQTQSITSYMGQGTAQEARAVIAGTRASRLSLHIRQQPRAARAGPDGKDRRAIDPPPVLQLMIDDFDIDDDNDMNELRSSYFVVHCRLVSATHPKKDLSTTQVFNDDGQVEVQRLLLGTTVASPMYCQDDPDPENVARHPVTSAAERPPSPSSRFIQSRSQAKSKEKTSNPENLPGSFFIFADLSVRKAGEYRLEFCLMKIEASSMIAGRNLPIIHTVLSNVFKVVNAKDFDQVQPSTELVKGLLDRGAGFPLKLKKGIREGQRRRQTGGESDDDDSDEG